MTTTNKPDQPVHVDIYDPVIYEERGIPHEEFALLRKECPVYWHEEPEGRGFWVVSKYDDLVYVSKNPQLFSSWRGGTNIPDYSEEDMSYIRMLMVNMDPPQHNKFRHICSRGFTPRMVRRMESKIRAATTAIVDNVIRRGECDFVTQLAAELPLQVIAELIGVPQEDRHKVYDWSNRLIGFDDPEYQSSLEDGRVASFELWEYANQLAEQRKAEGGQGEDLTSVLMNAEIDGEALTEMEFDSFFLMLCVAGNETTRNLISGGMLALLEHPEQLALLRAKPELLPTAVEEMLRWVTPVIHFRRQATQDLELRGVPIAEDDKVVIYYPSANRDEEIFDNPQTFDITRDPNDHVSFGIGQHSCLGLNLARLEIRVMFEELMRRMKQIELAGPVRRLRSNFVNGYKEMPVRFVPERMAA